MQIYYDNMKYFLVPFCFIKSPIRIWSSELWTHFPVLKIVVKLDGAFDDWLWVGVINVPKSYRLTELYIIFDILIAGHPDPEQ